MHNGPHKSQKPLVSTTASAKLYIPSAIKPFKNESCSFWFLGRLGRFGQYWKLNFATVFYFWGWKIYILEFLYCILNARVRAHFLYNLGCMTLCFRCNLLCTSFQDSSKFGLDFNQKPETLPKKWTPKFRST